MINKMACIPNLYVIVAVKVDNRLKYVFSFTILMPTQFNYGKMDHISSDSIVNTPENGGLTILKSSVGANTTPTTIDKHDITAQVHKSDTFPADKITFFGFIKSILFSDVLWFGISLACLLATVLFYFQILQPLIVQKYSETAQAQIIESAQKFNIQADQIDSLQQNIISNTENLSAESCTEEAKYDRSEKDRKDLENLKKSLNIEPRLKELPNFGVFYDSSIKNSYSLFVKQHEESIASFQPALANTKHVIEFVDYKNSWINQCIRIKNSDGNTNELQSTCKEMEAKADNYTKIAPAGIVSELGKPLENVRSLCIDINNSKYENYFQFNTFKLKWLAEYDNIRAIILITDSASIASIKTKFDITINQTKANLESILKNKQEFNDIWYLLNFTI
jgi:hypothetical protein